MRTTDDIRSDAATPIGTVEITLTINGQSLRLAIQPWTTLLDLLREQLHLTGTKKGCDHGQCGACTVLIDGKRINTCLTLAVTRDGADIVTIEGWATPARCIRCSRPSWTTTPSSAAIARRARSARPQGLINEGHATTRDEVREAMSGNLCRCGAYTNIADAVMHVLEATR